MDGETEEEPPPQVAVPTAGGDTEIVTEPAAAETDSPSATDQTGTVGGTEQAQD